GLGVRFPEIVGIDGIKDVEVAFHIDEKHLYIDELIPAASVFFEDSLYIGEDGVDLGGKVEVPEIAVVIELQPGHTRIMGVAAGYTRSYAAQEQEIPGSPGQGIQSDRFGGLGSTHYFFIFAKAKYSCSV